MYGMTKKKIIHVIADNNRNGCNGYWYAACGKWIMPAEVTETMPEDWNSQENRTPNLPHQAT